MVEAFAPYATGRFFSFTEEATPAAQFFAAERLARLRAVRAAVDPAGVFQANHDLDR